VLGRLHRGPSTHLLNTVAGLNDRVQAGYRNEDVPQQLRDRDKVAGGQLAVGEFALDETQFGVDFDLTFGGGRDGGLPGIRFRPRGHSITAVELAVVGVALEAGPCTVCSSPIPSRQ
jgi:hypothetical protein